MATLYANDYCEVCGCNMEYCDDDKHWALVPDNGFYSIILIERPIKVDIG